MNDKRLIVVACFLITCLGDYFNPLTALSKQEAPRKYITACYGQQFFVSLTMQGKIIALEVQLKLIILMALKCKENIHMINTHEFRINTRRSNSWHE